MLLNSRKAVCYAKEMSVFFFQKVGSILKSDYRTQNTTSRIQEFSEEGTLNEKAGTRSIDICHMKKNIMIGIFYEVSLFFTNYFLHWHRYGRDSIRRRGRYKRAHVLQAYRR